MVYRGIAIKKNTCERSRVGACVEPEKRFYPYNLIRISNSSNSQQTINLWCVVRVHVKNQNIIFHFLLNV